MQFNLLPTHVGWTNYHPTWAIAKLPSVLMTEVFSHSICVGDSTDLNLDIRFWTRRIGLRRNHPAGRRGFGPSASLGIETAKYDSGRDQLEDPPRKRWELLGSFARPKTILEPEFAKFLELAGAAG